MRQWKGFNSLLALFLITYSSLVVARSNHEPSHFPRILIVIFENMSYAEIKAEPTFKRLVAYSGYSLDASGHLIKLMHAGPNKDTQGNGYGFFSRYYNNHNGGDEPSRSSQPNYIAMTSGSIQGLHDNELHNIDADNLAMELMESTLNWKVYAENLPDPKASFHRQMQSLRKTATDIIKPYVLDPTKNEEENDIAEQAYYLAEYQKHHLPIPVPTIDNGCFADMKYPDDEGNEDAGYKRKHEPFISYINIQSNFNYCKNMVNASHFLEDLDHLPQVSFYIPNQTNDGHNGTLEFRTQHANAFLSKMLGTDPTTGEPLPDAAKAPLQRFMAGGGLLVITFDEPSVTGNPDKTIYTLLAGRMIKSGAYPNKAGEEMPVCYPAIDEQTKYPADEGGNYEPLHCNHYNLLRLIEENWNLRGLESLHTSAGYKYAFSLDHQIPSLWRG